jgi:sensor histidine kinase regulating citrate/malate metabolism
MEKERPMRKLNLHLQTKIALLIILVIFVSIVNSAFFITRWRMENIRKDVESSIMNIANIVCNTPIVKTNLDKDDGQIFIQQYVEGILKATKDIDVIVVADMQSIRYGHPNPDMVGKQFVGGDEKRVIQKGETYLSQAEGTLGNELRAFVPVYNGDNKQIGFVMVGHFISNIDKIKKSTVEIVTFSSLGGLILGVIGAFLLARRIKNTMLGYEPDQITKLYIEKREILEAMQEGIIAIDNNSRITLINKAAISMLRLGNQETAAHDIIGKDINDVFPTCRLSEVIVSGKEEKFKEQVMNDTVVVINRVPIWEEQNIIGAIATFNDKTMVTRLAEEVTGVKLIVEALRANNHEFLNKLHLVLGYIQLNRLDEAKKFIVNETEKHQHILSLIINNILDPTVAALILGKISRAKELGIVMEITEESHLQKTSGRITGSVLVTIIGNLLENAMESLIFSHSDKKNIYVTIKEDDKEIYLKVEDNGMGIKEDVMPSIFKRGYSTKEENRGRGLALIKENIENLSGSIEAASIENEGAVFTVVLPKEARND